MPWCHRRKRSTTSGMAVFGRRVRFVWLREPGDPARRSHRADGRNRTGITEGRGANPKWKCSLAAGCELGIRQWFCAGNLNALSRGDFGVEEAAEAGAGELDADQVFAGAGCCAADVDDL